MQAVTPVTARLMSTSEADLIIHYFRQSTPEHLESLGVDPTRLPSVTAWRQWCEREFALPLEQRSSLMVIWLLHEEPVGFSTADNIVYGDRANMHLHIIQPGKRNQGVGVRAVQESVKLYFDILQLQRLYCEPNAFNTAPNRTLQKAGFKYVKTHLTVPGPINFHQAVTQWVLERAAL